MSSFPQHKENVMALQAMGFDVSEAIDGGEVTEDSWNYDELVGLLADVIADMPAHNAAIEEEVIESVDEYLSNWDVRKELKGMPRLYSKQGEEG